MTVPPSVTLCKLHASEDTVHLQVRARVYAQSIGITAFILHPHDTHMPTAQTGERNACQVDMNVHMSWTEARHKIAHE